MDSITQASLGASVGYACWGKALGRGSLLWGAALGTLPDLDLLLYPWLDEVQQLYWHRGESHSVFFTVLGSLFLGWILWRLFWRDKMSYARACSGVFLIFSTHILIDYFTIYGTQLLAPLSRHGFAQGNLFIIDPLFTLPLLLGCALALIFHKSIGRRANTLGLVLASVYTLFSLSAQQYAKSVFASHAQLQGIEVLDAKTMATPFNTLLWRHVIRSEGGFYIGYYSLLAPSSRAIDFTFIPQNESLIEPYRHQRNVQAMDWFSQKFWIARSRGDQQMLSDIRFGEFRLPNKPPEAWTYFFSWDIHNEGDRLIRSPRGHVDRKSALKQLWMQLKDETPKQQE